MKPVERDVAHLWDMLDAAQQADEFANGIALDGLLSDTRTRFAIERALEIIGEAAKRVSARTRSRHAGIPWKGIIGFRNVLAREYGEIDYRRLYTVITQDLPILIESLKALLDSLEER